MSFEATRKVALFCSRGCKDDARNATGKVVRLLAKPVRSCGFCAADMPATMRTDAKFCSARCNHSAHEWWREVAEQTGLPRAVARLLGRQEIGDRDGWVCGLCADPVDRSLEYPDPVSASVDHVVPVSLGGSHDLSNLQLTHLTCNVRKRADA
jgi:5-methylcytosine-specific restriction endonuclease McrA